MSHSLTRSVTDWATCSKPPTNSLRDRAVFFVRHQFPSQGRNSPKLLDSFSFILYKQFVINMNATCQTKSKGFFFIRSSSLEHLVNDILDNGIFLKSLSFLTFLVHASKKK